MPASPPRSPLSAASIWMPSRSRRPGTLRVSTPILSDQVVMDEEDAADADAVSNAGVRPVVTHTLMHDAAARRRLAEAALDAVAFA